MDTVKTETDPAIHVETATEREQRIGWEAERIAKARASVAAGRVVSSERVAAWINSIGTDHELPMPRPE